MVEALLSSLALNEESFETLLSKLIGEAEGLQNQPGQGLIPKENNASDHVLALLVLSCCEITI